MKIKIIFLLINSVNLLCGQDLKSVIGSYYWMNKDSTVWIKLQFMENGGFEFIEDYVFDCTPAFVLYGHGKYKAEADSVLLMFDSIPYLKSESK
jgi:hypothetical protein